MYCIPDFKDRERRQELLLKIFQGTATKEERAEYEQINKKYAEYLAEEARWQAIFD